MNKWNAGIVSACILFLSGCASQPDEFTAAYISPVKYEKYNCDQLIYEMGYVAEKTSMLYQRLEKLADDDATQMGVGLILFWPALFFLEGGDGPEAVEYTNLKGEYEAIRTAAVQKQCDPERFPKSPEQLIKEAEEAKKAAAKEKHEDPFDQ